MAIAARLCPFTTSCVQRFLISGPDLRITARFSPETHSNVQRFWISGGKLGNHCRFFHGKDLGAAVIPDFRGQTWQSLQKLPGIGPPACSDSGIHGVNLGIAARNCPEMSSCVQRFLISGPDLRITARFSPETHSNVQRFWISGGKLGNHCRFFHGKDLGAAVIPDFRGQTWQSLQKLPGMYLPEKS